MFIALSVGAAACGLRPHLLVTPPDRSIGEHDSSLGVEPPIVLEPRTILDGRAIAHGVGMLTAGGDLGLVGPYIRGAKRRVACDLTVLAASVADTEQEVERLATAHLEELGQLQGDRTVTDIGEVMLRVVDPFRTIDARGRVVDAGWVSVLVAVRCRQGATGTRMRPG